ncbi:MAG: hypothetical protein QXY45_01990 [Candidatus Aenigmatarchaeota archaeon]
MEKDGGEINGLLWFKFKNKENKFKEEEIKLKYLTFICSLYNP